MRWLLPGQLRSADEADAILEAACRAAEVSNGSGLEITVHIFECQHKAVDKTLLQLQLSVCFDLLVATVTVLTCII